MSEMYEGIVFQSSEDAARSAFESLTPPFKVRLVRLSEGVFGVYRVADRKTRFDANAMCALAARLSESVSAALVAIYDNRSDCCTAGLYRNGELVEEFGEDCELWVLLDEDGEPLRGFTPIPPDQMDDDEEYDCIRHAIGAGLEKLAVPPAVTVKSLKDAFSYDRAEVLAEAG